MIRRLILFAICTMQPLVANAAPVIRSAPEQNPSVVVTDPSQGNSIAGGAREIWKVTYAFNNLEFSIVNGETPSLSLHFQGDLPTPSMVYCY